MRPQDVPRALLRQLIVPKAPMGQGVRRTQTENHPIRPLETAEELEQLLDWHHLIRFGEETKKNIGIFGNGWQFPISYSARQRRVAQSVSVLSSAPLSAVTGLTPVSKATFGVL